MTKILICLTMALNTMEINAQHVKKKQKAKYNTTFLLLKKKDFKNILPLIGKCVLDRPKYQRLMNKKKVNSHMRKWLLKELIFVNNVNETMLSGLTSREQLKYFDLSVNRNENFARRDLIATINGKQYGNKSPLIIKTEYDITKHDYPAIPKSLIRATLYVDEKIHPLHIELLNRIYNKGIVENKCYPLNNLEKKHFQLLPSSFQTALKPICKL